jgi:hypothetical protein
MLSVQYLYKVWLNVVVAINITLYSYYKEKKMAILSLRLIKSISH